MAELLTDENFLLFAAAHYNNAECYDAEEFLDDVRRLKYIKRLFIKYTDHGELKERLILNHIVILYNVFGSAATLMLFTKLHEHYNLLKPFLEIINRLPRSIVVDGTVINTADIPGDETIVQALKRL